MARRQAVLLMVITVFLWSTSGLLVKLSSLNALALTGARSAIAAVVVLCFVGRPRFTWSGAQIGGAIALVGAQGFFVAATKLTAAANAVLLQYTAPIYVAFLAIWLLKERARSIDWLTMAAIVAGMVLFFRDDLSPNGVLGNVFAVLSGISLAWMVICLRKQKDGSPLETVLLGNVLAALIGLPLRGETPTLLDGGILLFLGVFQLGLPFVLYAMAIKQLEAIEAVLIQTLEPIFNPIWVFLVIGEMPGFLALVGGAIVPLAITLRSLVTVAGSRRRPVPVVRAPAGD